MSKSAQLLVVFIELEPEARTPQWGECGGVATFWKLEKNAGDMHIQTRVIAKLLVLVVQKKVLEWNSTSGLSRRTGDLGWMKPSR